MLARRYFYAGVHRMEPDRSLFPGAGPLLPETAAVSECVLILPTGTGVTSADIQKICAIIRAAHAHAKRQPAFFEQLSTRKPAT